MKFIFFFRYTNASRKNGIFFVFPMSEEACYVRYTIYIEIFIMYSRPFTTENIINDLIL